MKPAELDNNFKHHPPRNEQEVKVHELIREEFSKLAEQMNNNLPESREKALVLTKLEEGMFWANACYARNKT